ncbi:unnamed protein product [marine sediment metagenome]|uniref:Transcriptional coactivator p15 (PC4) C-terminal domain-containing protein n=1 Tax=marine sediment metagenome TaxID=412755 RepID=X1HA70_9ZZZZ
MIDEVVVLAECEQDTGKVIRVTQTDYRDSELIHIREFFEDHHGALRPTKRGVVVTIDTFPRLAGCVLKACEVLGVVPDRSEE